MTVTDADFPHAAATDPERQHLHINQLADATKPTGVYIFTHGNGQKANSLASATSELIAITGEGHSTISWESVTIATDETDVEARLSDFALVMARVKENAKKCNWDMNSIAMGGRSRGSTCGWMTAHGGDPGIKGIYVHMHNALPIDDAAPFLAAATANSPPTHLACSMECPKPIAEDCMPSPNTEDLHSPKRGQRVGDHCTDLALDIAFTDGMKNSNTGGIFECFPDFAQGLGSGVEESGPCAECYRCCCSSF